MWVYHPPLLYPKIVLPPATNGLGFHCPHQLLVAHFYSAHREYGPLAVGLLPRRNLRNILQSLPLWRSPLLLLAGGQTSRLAPPGFNTVFSTAFPKWATILLALACIMSIRWAALVIRRLFIELIVSWLRSKLQFFHFQCYVMDKIHMEAFPERCV
jgi:hypothetical protein